MGPRTRPTKTAAGPCPSSTRCPSRRRWPRCTGSPSGRSGSTAPSASDGRRSRSKRWTRGCRREWPWASTGAERLTCWSGSLASCAASSACAWPVSLAWPIGLRTSSIAAPTATRWWRSGRTTALCRRLASSPARPRSRLSTTRPRPLVLPESRTRTVRESGWRVAGECSATKPH